MRKKVKMRKTFIFVLGIVIAFMIVNMISSKEQKEPLIIVAKELDISKTLGEQLQNFSTVNVTKTESQRLGTSVVRSLQELQGARIPIKLEVGSPIPKSMLTIGSSGGQFATQTKEFQTLYKFQGGVAQLPPGSVSAGDKLDIGLLYQDENKLRTVGLLMESVEVAQVTETDILVKVSQRDYYRLTIAKDMGQFILQLPGRKAVKNCEELTEEELKTVECYFESDKPSSVNTEEILQKLKTGSFGDEDLKEEVKNAQGTTTTNNSTPPTNQTTTNESAGSATNKTTTNKSNNNNGAATNTNNDDVSFDNKNQTSTGTEQTTTEQSTNGSQTDSSDRDRIVNEFNGSQTTNSNQ